MLLFQLLDRILGLTGMLILMHLLSPADFGIIAKAISASRRSRRRFIASNMPCRRPRQVVTSRADKKRNAIAAAA